MCIVANKDGQGIPNVAAGVDLKYATPNRAGAGVPSVPSLYASEIWLNSTTGQTYRAMETGTSTWIECHAGINAA